jgi:hypothetical protein
VLQHWSLEDQIDYSHLRALLTSLGAKLEKDDKEDKAMSLSLIETYLNFRSQDNEDDSQGVSTQQSGILEVSSKSDATFRSGSISYDINGSIKSDQASKQEEIEMEIERRRERKVSEALAASNHNNAKGVQGEWGGDSNGNDVKADISNHKFNAPTSGRQHQHSVESERVQNQECGPESASELGRGDDEEDEDKDKDEIEALAAFLEASKACEAKALQRVEEEEERTRERERERESERGNETEREQEEEIDTKLILEREAEEGELKSINNIKDKEKEVKMQMDAKVMNAEHIEVDAGMLTVGITGEAATLSKGSNKWSEVKEKEERFKERDEDEGKEREKEGVKAVKGLRERKEESPVNYFDSSLSSNSSQINSKPHQQATVPSPVIHYHSPPSRSPPSRSPQSQSPSKANTSPSSHLQPQSESQPSTPDKISVSSRPPSVIHYHAPPSNRSPTQSITAAVTASTVEKKDLGLTEESSNGVGVGQGKPRQLVDDCNEDEGADKEGDRVARREDIKGDEYDHEETSVAVNHQHRGSEERTTNCVVESIASTLDEQVEDREYFESEEREREVEGSVPYGVHGVMEEDKVLTEEERVEQNKLNKIEHGDRNYDQKKVKGNEHAKGKEIEMEIGREKTEKDKEKEERETEDKAKEEREKKIQIAQEKERERRRIIFKELEEQQIAQEALHQKHQEEIKQQQEELQILKSQVAKKVADKEREKDELKAIRDKLLLEAEHRRTVSIDIIPKQSRDDVMDEEKYKKLKNGTYEFGKIEMKEKYISNYSDTKSPNKNANKNINKNTTKSTSQVNKNESKNIDQNVENDKNNFKLNNSSHESELEDPYEEIQKHKNTHKHTRKDRSSLPDRSFDFLSPKDRSIRNSQMKKLDAQKLNSAANNARSSPQKLNIPISDHIQVRSFLSLKKIIIIHPLIDLFFFSGCLLLFFCLQLNF